MLNQLRIAASRTIYPAPASIAVSRPGTYIRHLSSFNPPPISPTQNPDAGIPTSHLKHTNITGTTTPHHPTAKMSTMPASHGHNAACCNIPPVVSTGYQAKGTYKEYGDLKTCAL